MCIKHRNDWYLHQKEHDYWLWILTRFSSSIYFSETKWYSKPGPCALSLPIIVAKCECDERCKFGLFKGRSGKFPTTLAFTASFYKGLDEFEADLDPKQIEKLLVFFEVISTQEKISKVKDTTNKQGEKKTIFCLNFVIYNAEKAGIQIGRGEVWDLWK